MTHQSAIDLMHEQGFPEAEAVFTERPLQGWIVTARTSPTAPLTLRRRGFMPTLREALVAAGFKVPPPAAFTYDGLEVRKGGKVVARAVSKTMAARIANALAEYKPGSRGY